MVAAIGTLRVPLPGGANAEVMKMLLELGPNATGDRVDEFVRGKLARKEKIPASDIASTGPRIRAPTHSLRQMSRDLGSVPANTACVRHLAAQSRRS